MASSSLTYIEHLAEDLTKLLTEDDDNYDVTMIVGEDDDIETFKIHSSILSVRTPYFKNAFSDRWKRTDGNKIKLEKPNIRPKIFKVILRYVNLYQMYYIHTHICAFFYRNKKLFFKLQLINFF
jgi:hypothetical protein